MAMIIIQALIALGTIAVAVMAIWGAPIRATLLPPKVRISSCSREKILTRFSGGANYGPRVIYYHLQAENLRRWVPVKECRILLRQIAKRGPDGSFRQLPMNVPHQFVWSPSQFTPSEVTLTGGRTFDFGHLTEGEDRWAPVLYWYPNNFEGHVGKNEAVRYSLEISGVGCVQKRYQVFEVAWDGEWTENMDDMERHLVINEISS